MIISKDNKSSELKSGFDFHLFIYKNPNELEIDFLIDFYVICIEINWEIAFSY